MSLSSLLCSKGVSCSLGKHLQQDRSYIRAVHFLTVASHARPERFHSLSCRMMGFHSLVYREKEFAETLLIWNVKLGQVHWIVM